MSDWADGEGFTTLEDVFASRDFGRPLPQAAAAIPAVRAAPRPRRTHLVTNRAIAVISASAAALSVVATLVVNGGGPSLAPVISAQHAPPSAPGPLTPVPQPGGAGQGATGASGASGTPGAAPAAPGTSATGSGSGSSAGTGTSGGGSSGATSVVALAPAPASASLASFTASHPAKPAPPAPPPPTTTTTPPPPPVSAGPAATGARDNGKGNAGQNNGKGNANGVPNNGKNGGGTGVVVLAAGPPGHAKGNA